MYGAIRTLSYPVMQHLSLATLKDNRYCSIGLLWISKERDKTSAEHNCVQRLTFQRILHTNVQGLVLIRHILPTSTYVNILCYYLMLG